LKRIYCDACQNEIEHDSRVYSFDPLLHVCETGEGRHNGYVDRDFNATSGRTVHHDLCLPCYNEIFMAAYKVMKAVRKNANR
jgi:hypothetical protein